MDESTQAAGTPATSQLLLATGADRLGEHRSVGVGVLAFKVVPRDSSGLFIIEITLHAKGGPARHFHYDQDEWFYVVEGEFILEVGNERMMMHAGDSLVGPPRVPHTWANVGDARGRMLFAFQPAGGMEGFFREITAANAMAPQDPELWRRYGMELVGPPLAIG